MVPGRDNRGPMTDRKLFSLDQGSKERASMSNASARPFGHLRQDEPKLPRLPADQVKLKITNDSFITKSFLVYGVLGLIVIMTLGLLYTTDFTSRENFCDSNLEII